MDYENAIKRLDEISNELENPKLELETAISLFDEGVKLAKSSLESLNKAEGKVTVIKKELDKISETVFN